MTSNQFVRWILKPAVFAAALVPIGWLAWDAYYGNLSVDPLADITHRTGDWALRFLVVTLAITPLRRVTGWNTLVRFRRMAGLFAFFYASTHFAIYIVADRFASLVDFPAGIVSWDTAHRLFLAIADDITKRPFITVGFTAWVCMLPLAVTSTAGWIRRLGGKNWNRLHMLIYVSGVAAIVHYRWLVKTDPRRPATYGAIVLVLLLFRVVRRYAGSGSSRTSRQSTSPPTPTRHSLH